MNQYVPLPGRVIAWNYKAGSGSIRQATQWARTAPRVPQWAVAREVWDEGTPCVLFLRHPLRRLRSNWRWWSSKRRYPQPIYGDKPSWERFVDLVLRDRPETRNPHWNPQCEAHTYCGRFIPTHVYRFEDIQQHWPDWCPNPLQHLNPSGGGAEPLPDYRLDDLRRYYAEDIVRWHDAESTPPYGRT